VRVNFEIVRNIDKSQGVREITCNISFQSNSMARFPANFASHGGMREGGSRPSRNRPETLGGAFSTNFLRNNSTETEERRNIKRKQENQHSALREILLPCLAN